MDKMLLWGWLGIFCLAAGVVADEQGLFVRTLSPQLTNPMEMSIADDGSVFLVERMGLLKVWDAATGQTTTVLELDVNHGSIKKGRDTESGLVGLALDPNFSKNRWLYIYYSPRTEDGDWQHHQLARFTYDPTRKVVDRSSEKVLLKVRAHRQKRIHEAGSIAFGPDGLLYLSTGDNQIRSEFLFSCKTTANSNDLRGKILRIRPTAGGGYEIPEGNLFPPGTANSRPEIFVMGIRNPFRIAIDQKTGWLLWGENGPPDRWTPGIKGVNKASVPVGFEEFNLAKKAGFYGYPLVIADQQAFPRIDYTKKTAIGKFDPKAPINDHPENTGIRKLPPAQKPLIWYAGEDKNFPELGKGGESAIAGPVYHWDGANDHALPKEYDGTFFIADWVRNWVKAAKLDESGNLLRIQDFLPTTKFGRPINLKLGPKGRLHVLFYGNGGIGHTSADGTLVRIEHKASDGAIALAMVAPLKNLAAGLPAKHPGTKLMIKSDCLFCHQATAKSVGPSFDAIATKYPNTKENMVVLTGKVTTGGAGVWGPMMMPPHPQHSVSEIETMLKVIFEVKKPKKKKGKGKKNEEH